jgi:nitroreductase
MAAETVTDIPEPLPTVPHEPLGVPEHEAAARARDFHRLMDRRRTVRDFASRPIPEGVLEWAIRTAATAPSGAHVQPWRFVVLTDPGRKRRLREAEERRAVGKAGITDVKAGTRFLRHNAASRMLRAAVALPTISAVLGHADPESTNQYMSVDHDRLLQCVLEVPEGARS